MWVPSHLSHLVASYGNSTCGRAQWVRLSGIPGRDLSIHNVYASTNVHDIIALWKDVIIVLAKDCRQVLIEYWNVVEKISNKSNLCSTIMSNRERNIFEQLTSILKVEDKFPLNNPIK